MVQVTKWHLRIKFEIMAQVPVQLEKLKDADKQAASRNIDMNIVATGELGEQIAPQGVALTSRDQKSQGQSLNAKGSVAMTLLLDGT